MTDARRAGADGVWRLVVFGQLQVVGAGDALLRLVDRREVNDRDVEALALASAQSHAGRRASGLRQLVAGESELGRDVEAEVRLQTLLSAELLHYTRKHWSAFEGRLLKLVLGILYSPATHVYSASRYRVT